MQWAIRRETPSPTALGRGHGGRAQISAAPGTIEQRCSLNTTSSAHPPQAYPGDLAFDCPDVYFCFPALGDSLLPATGRMKAPSCPVPSRGAGQASAQPPSARAPKEPASLQMDSLTRNQLAPGLGWLFAALESLTVWLLT